MTRRRPLHVGCSPLTKKIYAGSKSADGKLWLSDQTDVTTEALLAVVEMIGPGYKQALIATNGGPSFEIEVREISPPAPGMEAAEGGRDPSGLDPTDDSATAKPGRPETPSPVTMEE